MKYHDNGFIVYYNNYVHLQLLNVGNVILDLSIYKNKICEGTFRCTSSKKFNKEYINSTYSDDFLYNLFTSKNIYFKDKKNKILIKVQ